jgi:cholesterol transport system auxiliary component
MLTLTACSALRPVASQPPIFYALDRQISLPVPPIQGIAVQTSPTLIVNPPQAASGFDSQRIMYVREDHKLEYFAHSEWVDPPARMLGPLLVAAIDKVGAFGSVVLTPASVSGELRLDTQIIRLQQNFETRPSRVQFTLRAYLTDEKTRGVLAWHEFSAQAISSSENAQGGVNAANVAVQDVLAQLAQFLATRAR